MESSPGQSERLLASDALGQGFNPFLLSPRIACLAAIRGERRGEGGILGPISNQAFRGSIQGSYVNFQILLT